MLEKNLARTKILVTLGPASAREGRIRRMVVAGVDGFRLNMSHGDNDTRRKWIRLVKKVRRELARPVAIMVDLRGPRIRLGELKEERRLRRGEEVLVSATRKEGRGGVLPIDYRGLLRDLRPGQRILLRDGRVELKVLEVIGRRLRCKVKRGDKVNSFQGVNLPDSVVSAASLSAKDRADIAFAVEHNVDWIALSFVRTAKDIRALQRTLRRHDSTIPICAKIEHPLGVENLEEIIQETDSVMVARGDLAVEIGHAKVPIVQRRIIRTCIRRATPVVVATQMLESMIEHAQPTRAEVSDVATAVMESCDAVMLSGETAMGQFPVEACKVMHDIIQQTEAEIFSETWRLRPGVERLGQGRGEVGLATANAAVFAARMARAKLILAFTESGRTARLVSSFRGNLPLIGLTSRETSYHRMALIWGILPGLIAKPRSVLEMHRSAADILTSNRWLKDNDLLVTLAGVFSVAGGTNTMRLIPLRILREAN